MVLAHEEIQRTAAPAAATLRVALSLIARLDWHGQGLTGTALCRQQVLAGGEDDRLAVMGLLWDTVVRLPRTTGCRTIAERLRALSGHPAATVALLLDRPAENEMNLSSTGARHPRPCVSWATEQAAPRALSRCPATAW